MKIFCFQPLRFKQFRIKVVSLCQGISSNDKNKTSIMNKERNYFTSAINVNKSSTANVEYRAM